MNEFLRKRSSTRPLIALLAFVAVMGLVGVGCTDDSGTRWEDDTSSATPTSEDTGDTGDSTDHDATGLTVVASTTWSGALAKAAGAEDITVIAPADLQHQSDYDPKPSDLALLADADFVLLGGFEGFADRLTEAVGSDAELVEVDAMNTTEAIHGEVRRLAGLFGTEDAAERWLADFDEAVAELRAKVDEARPEPTPTVVVHQFMQPWVGFAGVESVGVFGPQAVSAAQLAEFIGASPDLVFDNAHVPSGSSLDDLGAPKVSIINFPPESLDLIEVFRTNTEAILAAFAELDARD